MSNWFTESLGGLGDFVNTTVNAAGNAADKYFKFKVGLNQGSADVAMSEKVLNEAKLRDEIAQGGGRTFTDSTAGVPANVQFSLDSNQKILIAAAVGLVGIYLIKG